MKNIQIPDLTDAVILTPAQMNRIHFAGNRTALTPEQLKELAATGGTGKETSDICHPDQLGKP